MKYFLLFFFFTYSSIICLAQVDLNLGLRAYYPFNGGANDASGNNNNPVFNNATLTADRFGNINSAYHFNGTDSYIKIPNSSSLNTGNAISLCAWVKPMGFYNGFCHGNDIILKRDEFDDPLTGSYMLRFDDSLYTGGINCTGTPDIAHENFYGTGIQATPPGYTPYVQPSQWYSVILTYDGSTAKLYVNCELKISTTISLASFINSSPLYFGGSAIPGFPNWLNGDLDEVRIYDRAINFDEVKAISGCGSILNCNNWLKTQNVFESVTVGDLDVTGNQITVEANFNCTSFPVAPGNIWEDIVSKHSGPADCNYALRMDMGAITTSNGFFRTPASCNNISLNKTYHVAIVYDGSTLKFYRDGYLMSQLPATGNLSLNNLPATIGDFADNMLPSGTNFFGYINEVRIWNLARTQLQIQTFMKNALPNPTTQTGLLAYYTFDNLINKQGNTTWNGTLNAGATINNTNPNCNFILDSCNTVIATTTSFTAPDTVCVNEPVQVVNTSVGTTDYYWSFCESTFANAPDAVNVGNPGGFASLPVFEDLVKDDLGNYYGFMVNNAPSGLIRYDFGNSFLNTPTATFLGNPGGVLPPLRAEGIRVVKAGSNWIAVVVGGAIPFGDVPFVATFNFGPSITNPAPAANNWGNIGNMNYPIDVFVFTENNNWYGYTVNADNNTITRFDFGTDFSSTPTAVNLGNPGGLNGPTGIGEIKDGSNWYLFITNELNNTLTRLDFGTSLLNTPTGTNLGTLGGAFSKPRDISFIRLCDGITGLAVNGQTATITKLDFQNNITGSPIISSLGNIGTLNFPHSISKLFREDNDIYAFIPNVNSNTISRLRFLGCQTIPGSALQTPAPITYSIPGIYNINLTTDIGLPTQSSFCKKIVVQNCIVPTTTSFTAPDTVCVNQPMQVVNTSTGTSTYYWSFCEANTNTPVAVNLGNPNGQLAEPTFSDIVQDGAGDYFVFVANHFPGGLVRLSYGNSLLNIPVAQNLGDFGGIIPVDVEGVQVNKVNGNWTAIMVGGAFPDSRILKLDFGASLMNTPVATNWGNIGGLSYPQDLYIFTENNNWYGYTVNALGNSITRFDFGVDFSAPPVGTDLGNLGGMDIPVGIGAIKKAGNWHLFITSAGNNKLIRLDFGNSLLNASVAVNLGNPGNVLSSPRGISFIDLCEGIEAFNVNSNNTISKLDFGNDLLGMPTGTSLGNLGALDFPYSISEFFRVNNDIYSFISIENTNSLARLQFAGCIGTPGSTLQNPPTVTYTTAGTYNINLLTDIGLATQGSFCKQIVVEDCSVQSISNIINDYTPVVALNPCKNTLSVEDATAYNAGDTVLLIQMKGAGIDSTNTAAFGTVTNYKNAGNYEFNYVKAKTGNIIELKNKITRQYDIPVGKVQLVRVPYYNSVSVTSTLTCLPWDGSKGGVLAFNVRDTLTLNGEINVSGKGFRGGVMHNSLINAFTCGVNDYFYPVNTIFAAGKGESIADLSSAKDAGMGSKASGGGGGMDPNSGGGGGGNGNIGGIGGWGYQVCPNYNTINDWGLGGNPLNYNPVSNKIFLAGGGGAGHCNNGFDDLSLNTDMDGGNGGGLVIISSNYIQGNNNSIVSNGDTAYELVAPGFLAHDGMGGGGAGGTILISNNNFLSNINVNAIGGKGGDMSSSPVGGLVGPGGGGAGGILWLKQNSVPLNVTVATTAGNNGVIIQNGNSPNGATPGQNGISVFNLVLPVDTVLFKPNIDSVRIKDSNTVCRNFDFHGLAYTNNTGIVSWHWDFGDTHTASTQDASNNYSSDGTYDVTLVATDINGCKDSITRQVTVVNCMNSISNIINDYTPVLALNPCKNSITVENSTAYNIGDTVLLIQMKGAVIDSTNTATFGNVTDYKNAGNYEFNYVKAKTGNIIELKNKLTRQYDLPFGKVQLIRVPYYTSVTVSATLTCLPWDGNKGGVLVLNARDTVTLNANIDVSANGFPGAVGQNSIHPPIFNCYESNFYYLGTSYDSATRKGEGISFVSNNRILGKGKLANAGGGGNSHNAGGGGGANGGQGGFGGYQFEGCGAPAFDNRGLGGAPLTYDNISNKIFMGGGGGAGQANNPEGFSGNGGKGGAIAIIMAGALANNGSNIINNGEDAVACTLGGTGCHEGMGGGGSGGTTLLKVPNFVNNVPVNCIGGKGGDMIQAGNQRVGPGGGGGGGIVWFNAAIQPPNAPTLTTGGINGTCTAYGLDPWGSTPGNAGSRLLNLLIPVDTVLFKPNIDSVRIKDSNTICRNFIFNGFAYTNTTGIVSWHWNFGDTHTASTQNASNIYSSDGTFNVTLVATDINGCKDSITKQVTVVNCSNNISGIINDYTPALAFDPCNNQLTVENAAAFNPGDTVLLIQMKGAVIDSANTTSFGTVTDYKNAGNYEYNFVQSKVGNVIKLLNKLTHQYDLPAGRVQLIRVPYYNSTVVTSTLTCLPWDGTKGGVLAFNVRDTLTLNADINVSDKGFRGGLTGNAFLCGSPDYATSLTGLTGYKGEGIAELNAPWNEGGGRLANGGGGSLGGNSGAGGGSNITAGGIGGEEYDLCSALQAVGGEALTNNLNTKIYLGGGGGGGQFDNGFVVYPGGNGGGIVFISSNHVKGNSFNIKANGFSRTEVINDEGGAAGGAGGSIALIANNFINSVTLNATGGDGNSNFNTTFPANCHGPGAGGSGGAVFLKQPSLPANVALILTGGNAGLVTNPVSACFNTTHGAANGIAGTPIGNFVLTRDTLLFVPNIDSVRIHDSATSCTGFNFFGLGYTQTSPIITWDWDFGDASSHTNTQNTSHSYSGSGPYTVHLIGTDINGCKDSITVTISLNQLSVNAGNDTAICSSGPVAHTLHGITTGTGYSWTPAGLLDNNTLQNPTATISTTTMFYLNTSGTGGCTAIDSVLLTVNPLPNVATINDLSICKLDSMLLSTVTNATTFQWSPSLSVNDPSIASPYFTDTVSQQMIITATNTATGCLKKDTVNITIKPLPFVISIPDTSLCGIHNVTLATSGAQTYTWLPATGLSNPGIGNPVFTGSNTETYIVTGTAANNCKANDTVTITIHAQPDVSTISDISICRGDSIQLNTTTDAQTNQWAPSLSVSNPNIPNPYFHDTVSQQMIITGTNATGCFDKDTVNITVKPLPVVHTIPDSSLCGAHNITFTTTGAQTYSWLPATDLSNPGIANPVFTGMSTQTYTVTGTGANTCVAKDTVTITVNAVPVVSTINNASICKGDSIQLISNSNAGANQWSPSGSVNNPGITNPYFIDTVSQTMIITGTNSGTGCFSTASVNITVKPLPLVRTINDFTSCAVNTVTLTTTGAQSYSWAPVTNLDDPTIANPVFTGPVGTYTYYVTGTGANGCIAKDSVNVTITPKPVFVAPENKAICINDTVVLNGNNGPDYQYTWSPGTNLSDPTIINPTADPVVTTIYSLLIEDHVCNSDSTFNVTVIVNPIPVVTATKSNDLDCGTPESRLTASGASHYLWMPSTDLSSPFISNPVASPYVTTQYIVIGTDVNGCSSQDTITVIRKGGKYFGFNIPNSFTPNGDNLNDCFGVTYWGETKNFHLMIYNRWGVKVFETHNVAECWDGKYKGNPSEIGNYVFYLNGETLCGPVTKKGNLLLIR